MFNCDKSHLHIMVFKKKSAFSDSRGVLIYPKATEKPVKTKNITTKLRCVKIMKEFSDINRLKFIYFCVWLLHYNKTRKSFFEQFIFWKLLNIFHEFCTFSHILSLQFTTYA